MNSNTTAPKPRLRDAIRDSGLATLAMVLVVGVAVAGWSASFISLHDFANAHMGLTDRPAWLVPSTFDGAALGLSMLSFRAAIFGRSSVGSSIYVYGFTALSSWINWRHIDDRAGGKYVSALLPIAAVIVFAKVLKEAREAYERRHGKQVFRVRPGLLLLRWLADRSGTRAAIRAQVLAIPVEAFIGMGAQTLVKDAAKARRGAPADAASDTGSGRVSGPYPNPAVPADQTRDSGRARRVPGKRSGNGSKRASKRLDEAQLWAEAERLNAESWAADDRPVALRRLMAELHIGQPRATGLLDALTAAPAPDVEDASDAVSEMRIPLQLGEPIRGVPTVNGTQR